LGRIDGRQKDGLIRDCAFTVLPSRFETFSLSALEGMAYGKPVVCFDLPRLAWIPTDCAVRVPPFDVAQFALAVHELAAKPEYRAELGRRAYALSGDYDWDRIGERYRTLVATVLGETGAVRGQGVAT